MHSGSMDNPGTKEGTLNALLLGCPSWPGYDAGDLEDAMRDNGARVTALSTFISSLRIQYRAKLGIPKGGPNPIECNRLSDGAGNVLRYYRLAPFVRA